MNNRAKNNYLSLDDSVLCSIVKEGKRKAVVTKIVSSPRKKKVSAEDELDGIVPNNDKVFTLKEAIQLMI